MPAWYRLADVGLVPLRKVPLFRRSSRRRCSRCWRAASRSLASLEGEAAEILRASGAAVVVGPEDVEALAAAVSQLAADPGLRSALGSRGRPYAAKHYDRRVLAARYLELLEGAIRKAPRGAL